MATKLSNLVIKEVSLVDDPANPKAEIILAKNRNADSDLISLAKRGQISAATADQWYAEVQKRAALIRQPSESEHQALSRALTSDDDAKALFRAQREARLAEQAASMRNPVPGGLTAKEIADQAHKAITAAAAKVQEANPKLSPHQAFARVAQERPDLWERHRAARRVG